jgi:tetratricopeptide (TPR) repeat protein
MSFVRRKRGQVLLVHNERAADGRVKQRELYRFASPVELEQTLAPAGWTAWTRSVAWREPDVAFDWAALRTRLVGELEAWRSTPAGAKHRRDVKVERLASELVAELAPLSRASASDAALLARLHPSLRALNEAIARLLPHDTPPLTPRTQKESSMENTSHDHASITRGNDVHREAEDLFDTGMEHWWESDRTEAARWFRKALKVDPMHADAHNHLGIIDLDARRLTRAEDHFRAAVAGGERHLERDGRRVAWGFLENRPYLRGLGNLGLVLEAQRRWAEAVDVHQRLLRLNPDDNQGVRYLVGVDLLRVGDDTAAGKAFRKCLGEEVGCAFGLALAELRLHGRTADVGEALLTGFALNRYVAPMLLGVPWRRLDGWHGTNMAEPEWANEVVTAQAELWQAFPGAAEVLRSWWNAAPVVTWRAQLDDVMVRLQGLDVGQERSTLVSQGSRLRSRDHVKSIVRSVHAAS